MINSAEDVDVFTPVMSSGVLKNNKNPLFNMLMDEKSERRLSCIVPEGCYQSVHFHDTDTSNYVLFDVPIIPVDFPIFKGFFLVDLHLRIDLFLTKEQSDSSMKKLDPNHITLRFSNEETAQSIIIHLYCNHMGNFIQTNGCNAYDELGNNIELSKLQKVFLYQQAKSSLDLLQTLVMQKNAINSRLRVRMGELNLNLALLQNDETDKTQILQELIDLAHKKNRYSHYLTEEYRYYEKQLHAADILIVPAPLVALDTSSMPLLSITSEQSVSNAVSTIKKASKKSNKKQQLKKQKQSLITLIDGLLLDAPLPELSDKMIPAWVIRNVDGLKTLDALILHLYSGKAEMQAFINEQCCRLPIGGSLLEYYSKQLLALNLDVIRQLSTYMEDTVALYNLYDEFLTSIERNNKPLLQLKRIEIAHVLHETSETYNQILLEKQYRLSLTYEDADFIMFDGVLARMISSDNINAFSMYLEQGISPSSVQKIMATIPYNTLGGLISVFLEGPRLTKFLDVLLPYSADITSAHVEQPNLLRYNVDGCNIQRNKKGEYFFSKSNKRLMIHLKNLVNQAMTPLGFAIKHMKSEATMRCRNPHCNFTGHPDLIRHLAQSTCPEMLIRETMDLFENSNFYTSYSNTSHGVWPSLFTSFDEAMNITKLNATCSKDAPLHDKKLSISFALANSVEKNPTLKNLSATAQVLLTQCIDVFKEMTPEQQGEMIQNFSNLAIISMRQNESNEFLFLMRATLFCCVSMALPTCREHETALKMIALMVNMDTTKSHGKLSGACRELAHGYFKGLSLTEKEQLRISVPKIIGRIEGTKDTQSFFSEAPSLPASPSLAVIEDKRVGVKNKCPQSNRTY